MPAEIATIERAEIDKGGRPCKYETHVAPYLERIFKWLQEGMTDYSIADQLGIHQNTLIKYRDSFCDLSEVYTRARTERNRLVMNSMFAKSTGIVKTIPQQKVTKDGDVVDFHETIYVAPDVNAADLFLRNNDPEYKSARSVESGGNLTVNFQLPERIKEIEELDEQIKTLEMQLNQRVYELKDA